MADAAARLDPFRMALAPFIPERLAAIHRDLAASEVDPFDRDAWALSRSGAELMHELRPEDGLGDAVAELVALAHAGFLYWQQGERVVALTRPVLDGLVRAPQPAASGPGPRTAYYLQLPPRRVWGTPVAGVPPEPLDGWFAITDGVGLELVAVFGLLPGRLGFTVAHVGGAPPGPLARPDGTALFAPTLEGGAAAGLWSLEDQLELLELGWRAHHWALGSGPPAVTEEADR